MILIKDISIMRTGWLTALSLASASIAACADEGQIIPAAETPTITSPKAVDAADMAITDVPAAHRQIARQFAMASREDAPVHDLIAASDFLKRIGAVPMAAIADRSDMWAAQAAALDADVMEKHKAEQARIPDRGRVRGPAYRDVTIGPGESDAFEEIFYAAEPVTLTLDTREGRASLHVKAKDGARHACQMTEFQGIQSCEWMPLQTTLFEISIANEGAEPLQYLVLVD